jgi:hypothetical protein
MSEAAQRIRLQVLVTARKDAAEIAARWLEAHGVEVTGRGARTLSAAVPKDAFRALFGEPPATVSGFTEWVEDAPPLPVPAPLADHVELITPVPRHRRF